MSQQINAVERIAGQVRNVLRSGFHLGPDVLSFIESTYAISPRHVCHHFFDVLKTMEEPDDIVEFIVYPDERVQMLFEPVFESIGVMLPEKNDVLASLVASPVCASIFLPEKNEPIMIDISKPVLERFIRRLNMGRAIHPALQDAFDFYDPSEKRYRTAVKLRNSRFAYTDNRIEVLVQFLNRFPADDPSFFDALDFMLEFFTEIKDESDIMDALITKKKILNHHIQKAEAMEDCLSKTNVETFLLSGNRVCGIHVPSAQNHIAMIRSILYHVFKLFHSIVEDDTVMTVETYDKH
ncbi:MAG: hypothetical protein KJ737_17500 [Proteobacteria bacterium]|nr:hypothetical protein [Pseudomonadota bacterium]